MVDILNSKWSELDASNNAAAPDGLQGGYAPSTIAPTFRAGRGALKRQAVQHNAMQVAAGSNSAYTLTYAQAPEQIFKGQKFAFFLNHTNTGAATLNINGLGTKALVRNDGTALTAGQLVSGSAVIVFYDGTNFRLQTDITNNPVFAGTITGNGSGLTNLNASNLGAGSVPNDRMVGDYSFDNLTLTKGMTVGPGGASVDGTMLVALSNDRPWYIKQRENDSSAALSIENYSGKLIYFSADETYAGPNVQINAHSADPFIKVGTNRVFHQGNDGPGSGLDADTVDGYQAVSLYRNNAEFSTTGNLTISNTAPAVILSDTTSGSYNTRIVVDANNWYLQKALDGAGWSTFMQFEMDTTNAYANGSQIWTDAKVTANTLTSKLGYTPANGATVFNAGNGLSGGGTLGGSRTFTLGTPGTITASTTNSVSTTSHTHDFDIGTFMYTGTSVSTTNFPVGSMLLCYTTSTPARNETVSPIYTSTSLDGLFIDTSGGAALSGTWRNRGFFRYSGSNGIMLIQRTP